MGIRSKYTIEIPEVPLHLLILSRLSEHGNRVGLVNGVTGKEYNCAQLIEISRKVGSGLARHGVKKGETMAIYLANCPEYFFMYFACLRLGVTVSPANHQSTVYELKHHITDSQSEYAFAMKENISKVMEAAKSSKRLKKIFLLDGEGVTGCIDFHNLLNDNGDLFPDDIEINPREDIALLPYSSGTTGLPKGVMLTHYNIVANFIQAMTIRLMSTEGDDDPMSQSFLAILPFFHVYGLLVILTASLIAGTKIITLPKFIPEQFLAAIQKYKVTGLPLVPPLVIYLAKSPLVDKYDISSVNRVFCGAAALTKETADAFAERFKTPNIKQGYGMTETTFVATVPLPTSNKRGSVGVLVPNTEARVVDPETGRDLGVNEKGEIWLRGPQITQGYLNLPAASHSMVDRDGWLRTGDIGYYDNDEEFYITGRIKELIKYKAFQVPPAELEALLLEHPGVTEAAVIGIPDQSAGELPRAFIVPTPGVRVTAKELDQFVKDRAIYYKWLRGGIQFVDNIPKTPTGKIIRREVAKLIPKSKM